MDLKFGNTAPANAALTKWVDRMRAMTDPDRVFWCDGSEAERDFLYAQAVQQGVLIKLNEKKLPGCYYHRSNPNDVARVEQCTFICTPGRAEAGPTNNWVSPRE